MRFYSFKDILEAGDCERFVREILGAEVKDGRCAAVWRGGDNPSSVSLTKELWHDFRDETGGNLITLCALTKFGGNKQQAQEFLGDWLKLTPTRESHRRDGVKKTRYQSLLDAGYSDVRHYIYTDENGKEAHTTIRLEKPGAKKEFVQRAPGRETLNGCLTYLYNLPAVLKSETVYLAEGEKDAETLISWGLCGTTAPCGANKWEPRYTDFLKDRDVVIVRDRDEAGFAHAVIVSKAVFGVAKSVKVVCPWKVAKDVTEWAEIEHGNAGAFLAAVDSAAALESVDDLKDEDAVALLKAKDLNIQPLQNYIEVEKVVAGRTKTDKIPRTINAMVQEVFDRFLGFPRCLGEGQLFDFDRDTDKIRYISSSKALVAWIGEKSNRTYDFARIPGAVNKDELYEGLISQSRKYESIIQVPIWPPRTDVFYGYRDKYKPSKGHRAFLDFLKFFSPKDEENEYLLRIFFAAPIYYRRGIQRPAWEIDSVSGVGVGKTSLVEILAELYKCIPLRTSANALKQNFDELKNGTLLSARGRQSRILLLDNVTGKLTSNELADLITCDYISGRPKYGTGEEVRPNDLTYCITANNGELSEDLTSRAFTLVLRRTNKHVENWKSVVLNYVRENRTLILGDIIDILDCGANFNANSKTRTPEFEHEVAMPLCGDVETYERVMARMLEQRENANVDYEEGQQIEQIFEFYMTRCNINYLDTAVVFINHRAYEAWFQKERLPYKTADLKRLIRAGKMPHYVNEFFQFPTSVIQERNYGMTRGTGVLYIGGGVTEANFTGVIVIDRTAEAGETGIKNGPDVYKSRDNEKVIDEIRARQIVEAEYIPPQPEPAQPEPAQPDLPMSPSPPPSRALPRDYARIAESLDEFPVMPYVP